MPRIRPTSSSSRALTDVSNELNNLADSVDALSEQVSDALFVAVRHKMRAEDVENAKELEKRLAKVRRHLVKAASLLRGAVDD